MPSEQWSTGLITLTTASQIVVGSASCDWLNQIEAGHVLKRNEDGEVTYAIATVLTATRLLLSANYAGTTGTGLDYIVCRSFTSNRGFWRPLQGDSDWAEIMSLETIDKIDTDIQDLSASVNINASNIDALQANMINANASIGAVRTNANASIDALQANMINANASIDEIKGQWFDVNASNFAASLNNRLRIDSKTFIPTITLPATPIKNGDFVEMRDVTGHFNGSNPIVLGNGNNINGQNASIVLDISWMTAKFTYVNASIGYHVE